MYIAVVPNRSSPPAILLRESYRDGGKVKTRTLANLSDWSPIKIEALRAVLGDRLPASGPDGLEIVRTRPHGHVAAVLGTLRRVGLERVIDGKRSPERDRCVAMIVARILAPRSKLALARALSPETLQSTLGEELAVESVTEDELYAAMDWLIERQDRIERSLAKKHLSESTLVLYDVSSTYFEGHKCPLGRFGHSRDGKRDKLQIVFGLLTNDVGCPVAVEVFEGNTADPKTVAAQIEKLCVRFGLKKIVLVGDRGMLTSARIKEDLKTVAGVEWITALRNSAIQKLLKQGLIQLSLFDEKDLAEVTSPDYPGERLMVCKNPLLAEERKRKREELLCATEKHLENVKAATTRKRNQLKGKDKIALRVGKVIGRFKMGKHFRIEITDSSFSYERDQQHIEEEAVLDGIYVVRTSLSQDRMTAEEAVRSYKRLAEVESAFRSLKTVDLKVRPIYHHLADRVRAHVLLCVLAYYVEWHMRDALAPVLFEDDDKPAGDAIRDSIVAPAKRSPRADDKASSKRTESGEPVHSFQTLLADLATIAKNRVQPMAKGEALPAFDLVTTPTPPQRRAFELLGVRL
jgi:transposase